MCGDGVLRELGGGMTGSKASAKEQRDHFAEPGGNDNDKNRRAERLEVMAKAAYGKTAATMATTQNRLQKYVQNSVQHFVQMTMQNTVQKSVQIVVQKKMAQMPMDVHFGHGCKVLAGQYEHMERKLYLNGTIMGF